MKKINKDTIGMDNYFYNHAVDFGEIEDLLESLSFENEVQEELYTIVHHTLYIEVIKMALDEMPAEMHTEFLELVEEKPHDDGLWVLFVRTVNNAEYKFDNLVQRIKQDFLEMLHDYKDASKEWLEADLRTHRKFRD